MSELKPFKILSENIAYQEGERFKVVSADLETPNKEKTTWSYIKMRDGAIVFPLDKDNNVYIKINFFLDIIKSYIYEC